jgi:hypothetical protein
MIRLEITPFNPSSKEEHDATIGIHTRHVLDLSYVWWVYRKTYKALI